MAKEQDIVSNRVAVHYNNKRTLVGDTDTGAALKEGSANLLSCWKYIEKVLSKRRNKREKYSKVFKYAILNRGDADE